jgi:hypothetical protein
MVRWWRDEHRCLHSQKKLSVLRGEVVATFAAGETALTAKRLGLPEGHNWDRPRPPNQYGHHRKYLVRIDADDGPDYRVVQQPSLVPAGSVVVDNSIQLPTTAR